MEVENVEKKDRDENVRSLTTASLGKNIRRFGDILGDVIKEQAGDQVFDVEEQLRLLCKESRSASPESIAPELRARISDLVEGVIDNLDLTNDVLKSFSTYFALVNLAEEHERILVLKNRAEKCFGQGPMDESIAQAVKTLVREGFEADQIDSILNEMLIMPVFTAHPTESKRRTTRQILKYLSDKLSLIESPATRVNEIEKLTEDLKGAITLLWQSDDRRKRKLTVMDEVRNTGLYFFENTLFDIVPKIYRALEKALQNEFPDHQWNIPPVLRFGSWIGGDRDGNPFVTVDTTESAIRAHTDVILERYSQDVNSLYEHLSPSKSRSGFSREFLEDLQREKEKVSGEAREVIERFDEEPYRQKLILMYQRLEATRANNQLGWQAENGPENSYQNSSELLDDLLLIRNSLLENKGEILTRGRLADLIWRVRVFGFHLATLDIRQHSGKHESAVSEIVQRYKITECYEELDEVEKVSLLSSELSHSRPLTAKLNFSEATNEAIALFRKIKQAHLNAGPQSIESYIISMTESVSDMLEVLLLMQDSDLFGKLDIVPLFETVDDLRSAPETMQKMFDHPIYAKHLAERGGKQQIMIGYSDSNKDGGFLQANWMLFTAQRKLATVCQQNDIRLTLFHGRGGSIGRGGGPANRAILAQPPESVRGRIRITEQGEVVSSRYTHPEIAFRHLQQLFNAVLCSSGKRPEYARIDEWSSVMEQLCSRAYNKYRELVDHPNFLEFFQQSTPIDQVGALNLGSRPAKRRNTQGLGDLRAIPWVFAWTQSRTNVPSWFGVGTAIESWLSEDPSETESRLETLRTMYREWPFLNSVFGNVHLGMGRADMGIAELYKDLVPQPTADKVFGVIQEEYLLTRKHLLQVTEKEQILDTEIWLQHSIRMRNPYVDPMNYMQVALLHRLRESDKDADSVLQAIAQSISGIAAGLQNVG